MSAASRSAALLLHAGLILLGAAAGAAVAYRLGQDVNFDQLNYHYYSADAYWTNRLGLDVAPGQVIHSFFSPLVYLPFYAMVNSLTPPLVGMVLGAMQGANLWLLAAIAWIVTQDVPRPARLVLVLAATAISVASPMAISELGTSMTDLLLAFPVLGGLALLLRARPQDGAGGAPLAPIALAGVLLGGAVSLKLTNAPFAFGLFGASLVGWPGWRARLGAAAATAAGGTAGFAAIGGFWYLRMWRMFGNPVFPYFNTVFRSPDYQSSQPVFDDRFKPLGLLDALTYPLDWATITHAARSELPFRDVRFALLGLLVLIAAAVLLARRGRGPGRVDRAGRRLAVFSVIAFAVWMYVWSIQRYIVVLELLAGPLLIVALRACGLTRPVRGWALAGAGVALAVLSGVTVEAPDWGHLPWSDRWYVVGIPDVPGDQPIYFLDGEPLSYVVAGVLPGSALIEFRVWEDLPAMGNTVFVRRIGALLADPRRATLRAIGTGPWSDSFVRTLAHFGLKPDGACQTALGRPLTLTWCRLARAPASG